MKILLISFLIVISYKSITLSDEQVDCSMYSKLSAKYYSCKAGNFVKETKDYQKKEWKEEKEKVDKVKKKILN